MKRFYSFSKLAIFAVAVFVGAYLPSTISLRANGKQASVSLPTNISVVNVPSKAMNKTIPTMIVLPSSYDINKTKKYPVLYLLHGFGGNHTSWLRIRPDIQKLASQFEMIIVSPDGFKSSWYWDSPIDPTVKYETFVSKELVEYIDLNYRTNATRKGRAITGLSMGGHGGLWLGFRHQDVYGACGAMSGGVDIRPFPNNWEMAKRLGDASKNADIWEKHTVINQLHLLKPNSIRIAFECGVDDFFYEVNEKLHKELLYRNIPHDYTTRPGRHNSPYWNNALPYQMLFFSNGF
ncbi:MAG: esterase family protein [Verrucomicrobiaceae bacterium]|nr:esterase family protein [Verrucomicrobiaceae bacterium]